MPKISFLNSTIDAKDWKQAYEIILELEKDYKTLCINKGPFDRDWETKKF